MALMLKWCLDPAGASTLAYFGGWLGWVYVGRDEALDQNLKGLPLVSLVSRFY